MTHLINQQLSSERWPLATLILIFMLSGCTPEGPRDSFRSLLAEDVEELETKLRKYTPGFEEVERTMVGGGGASTSTVEIPNAVIIGNRIRSLDKRFSKVSLALLTEDLAGYDTWALFIKQDVERYRKQLEEATTQLANRVRAHPEVLTKPYNKDFYGGLNTDSVYAPVYGFGLETIVLKEDGEIYFAPYGAKILYSPKDLFQFDIDEWLQQVKIQSQSMQNL